MLQFVSSVFSSARRGMRWAIDVLLYLLDLLIVGLTRLKGPLHRAKRSLRKLLWKFLEHLFVRLALVIFIWVIFNLMGAAVAPSNLREILS